MVHRRHKNVQTAGVVAIYHELINDMWSKSKAGEAMPIVYQRQNHYY